MVLEYADFTSTEKSGLACVLDMTANYLIEDPVLGLWENVEYPFIVNTTKLAQSTGVVQYIDCFSTEGKPPALHEFPGYNTKQSDGEVPIMLEL